MADITLTVVGSAVGTIISGVSLAPDDSDRLLAFLAATHGLDSDGEQRTPQQMIDAYWAGMVSGTLSNVMRWEQETASKAARDAVAPITPILPNPE